MVAPGTTLGSYQILSALGAGGMGEVYRARDTKLGRDVAIKILPEAFSADPDRVARFQREAQVLAALNHPNIATIHGLDEANGLRFLVLELVDGEALDARLRAGGALPLDEALAVAKQIVDAFEAAHEKGIIHRDLKPANIMVTAEGRVKVLDFGLAKYEPGGSSESGGPGGLTHSPTLTFAATQAGMILGTAAYMSPEQAKGRAADKRSDVWSFGCVLFEMLTGKRAFEGEDVSDTLAAILRGEPDWSALPANVPPHVRAILTRCLQKDRKARIPDVSVVRFMLDDTQEAPAPAAAAPAALPSVGVRRLRVWQAVSALLTVAAVAAASAWYVARSATPPVMRYFVSPPENTAFVVVGRPAVQPVLSPDGRTLAFTARDAAGKIMLYLRPIDSLVAHVLAGTENAAYPFWSPDGRFIAYSGQAKMMKAAVGGGPPQTICAFSGSTIVGRGGAWNREGVIVFNNGPGPLHRVSAAGGEPSPAFKLAPGQSSHNFPSFLPDGRHVLFYAVSTSRETSGVYVGALDTGETLRLTIADGGALYDVSSGRLLFSREGTLLAQPFDPKRLALAEEPVPVAEHVETAVIPGIVSFSVSASGVLAYGIGSSASAADLLLTWVDRQGKALGPAAPAANYRGIDLSPDGRSIAAHRHDGQGGDVWVIDLGRGTSSRFTFDASQDNSAPIWSPDGTAIAFASLRGGKWGIYGKASNNAGSDEKLFEGESRQLMPMSWAPDGRTIAFTVVDPKNSYDVWRLTLSGGERGARASGPAPPRDAAVPVIQTTFTDLHPQVSPDGRWMAYWSNESGRPEVQVVPYPSGAGKWQVSVDGGNFPRWRADGRELFFMSQASRGKMMAVDVKAAGSVLEFGPPRELFDTEYVNLTAGHPYNTFAVSADGQKFVIPRPVALNPTESPVSIAVVVNWAADIVK